MFDFVHFADMAQSAAASHKISVIGVVDSGQRQRSVLGAFVSSLQHSRAAFWALGVPQCVSRRCRDCRRGCGRAVKAAQAGGWLHKGGPPDFELVLVQNGPQQWVNTPNLTLLAELLRRGPQAVDWAGMQDVVPLLDSFEAARDSKTARRH